jgi:hypothetical protein
VFPLCFVPRRADVILPPHTQTQHPTHGPSFSRPHLRSPQYGKQTIRVEIDCTPVPSEDEEN